MAIVKILNGSINSGWKVGDHVEMNDKKARELAEKGDLLIVSIVEPKEEVVVPKFKVPKPKALRFKMPKMIKLGKLKKLKFFK